MSDSLAPQPALAVDDAPAALDRAAAPPTSAVSQATGLVGLAGLAAAVVWLQGAGMAPAIGALICLAAAGLPMVVWALAVEKVHRRATTGLDFALRRPAAEVWAGVRVKLVGLYAIWLALGAIYFAARTYAEPKFDVYFALLTVAIVPLAALAPLYLFLLDRHARDPHDGLWHTGRWLLGRPADREKVADQLRGWAIKGFFLAFMVSVCPLVVAGVVAPDWARVLSDPAAAALLAIKAMFLIDVVFGTLGYLLTFRPLDSHIRSANPYLAAWVAALACYPPFLLVGQAGPLDYSAGTQSWTVWFAGSDALLALWGGMLVALAGIYGWSTMIFGMRFSNLTHRGIVTNGPYRWFKHPAYLSKNLFWWLSVLPFLSLGGAEEAVRNCLLLGTVNLVYWLRAKTEERHLMADPDYRAYSAWIAVHGALPRMARALGFGGRPAADR
jgi:protein-S-isoprenylcysteine O-methyltransferase Ste14